MKSLFDPSSVAVIGASREAGSVGHVLLRNVIQSRYAGKVFPVNPKADNVLGLTCYHDIRETPEPVDLAVIAVPAQRVPDVMEGCGEKETKVAVVVSAGFKEVGSGGAELERQVLQIARDHGIRVVGPNCLGVIDTHTPLNATFAANMPPRGNIALVSQSGALLTAALDWSTTQRFGFSKIVSLGNKADVDEVDMIKALQDDPHTASIALYVEGIRDGVKFVEVAKEAVKKKPITVLKSGVTEAGSRAVSSHTGSLAGSDVAYETAFKQAGILRVSGIEEFYVLAEAFSSQVIPNLQDVVVVTNAGGPGILATDACERHGVKLARMEPEIIEELRRFLPAAAGFHNPVDVLGDARAKVYSKAIRTVLSQASVGAGLVILTPQAPTEPEKTATEIVKARGLFPSKPVVAVFMGGPAVAEAESILASASVPCYPYPEQGVVALSALTRYSRELRRPLRPRPKRLKVDKEAAAAILEGVERGGRISLLGHEAKRLMTAYGIHVPKSYLASNADEAGRVADQMGYPVVLKVSSPQILHKTDVGGVRVNVNARAEVEKIFEEIIYNSGRLVTRAEIFGVEVYTMVPQGREVIIGLTRDPQFGPLIMFGAGGIYANFMKDVSFRLPPISKEEALEMIAETKIQTLLAGVRGEKPSDIESVADVLVRVSQLALDFQDRVLDMDLNPVFVYEEGKGSIAVDVKVTLSG